MAAPEIEALFDDAALRAERIVALLRLAVAVVIGGVFAIAVSRQTVDDIILVRQLALAAATIAGYLILALIALWVVAAQHFRPWMAWIFSSFDVLLLLVSLDGAMGNTGMHGDYLPAAPVIWLAPVILAFGVLRYNPLLQAYIVTIAVLGFIAIVVLHDPEFVLNARPGAPDFTPHFFTLPTNVVRLFMVVLFGAVLIAAAVRARRLLARAIAEGSRRANLTRYLPRQVAEALATMSPERLMRGRRQHGAVLFIDIRGFTARTETMDPAEVSRFLAEFRRIVREAVEPHGGIIDKHIGDAAMIVFGLPTPSDDDARHALAAARDVLAGIGAWNAKLRAAGEAPVAIGIGAHWGELFVGAIGDEHRLEFSVLGDTVNVASRLEYQTKQHDCALIVSQDLLDAAGEDPKANGWVVLPPQILRGRHTPTAMFGLRWGEIARGPI
jgi:adenylate cyclase